MNVEYLRFFVYQIHFLRSFLRRPHTDRFPDDVLKKLRRNRNRDSCEKNATGVEKTGIRRIPAGMGNLGINKNDTPTSIITRGDTLIGDLLHRNMLLIPFAIDPLGRFGLLL